VQTPFPIWKVIGEVAMKCPWQVRRQMLPASDGTRRWDRAYRLILGWEASAQQSGPLGESATSQPVQEVNHEDSGLRARLDPASGSGPNH
jgi:hypothetical protein